MLALWLLVAVLTMTEPGAVCPVKGVRCPFAAVPAVPLEEAIHGVVEAKRAAGYRPAYVRGLRRYLLRFLRWCGPASVAEISVAHLEQWFNAQHEALSSRASNTGRLSALFAWALRHGYTLDNPTRRLERIRIDRSPPQFLSPEQAGMALRWAQKYRPDFVSRIAVGLFAGVRPEEARRLNRADIGAGHITISAAASKVHRRRLVPINDTLRAWLDRYHWVECSAATIRRRQREMVRALGWSACPQDLLRHTAATYTLAVHQNAAQVALWLGNSPKILLTHYAGLVTPEQAAKFWALRP